MQEGGEWRVEGDYINGIFLMIFMRVTTFKSKHFLG